LKTSFIGRWRIVEMELWDQEFIDLEGPGHITFTRGGGGELHFGAVNVTLDWRLDDKEYRVDFTFEGFDEGDEVSGRGWAEVEARKLTGKIAFHHVDESGFVAQKARNLRT
jgi:hypothetical protein